MHHESQKYFRGVFILIPKHQKGYLNYVPSSWKIVSSHDILFDEIFLSVLAYTSLLYSEALDMWPEVLYILYSTSYHEETGDIITFSQFEEGG